MAKKKPYSHSLAPDRQISTEEMIASTIFEEVHGLTDPLDEESCAELGREILYQVLRRFRPDLFVEEKPNG